MSLVFSAVCSHAPGITGRAHLADPAVKKRFETAGLTATPSSAEAFGRLIAGDIAKWAQVFRNAGLEPQ